MNYIKIPSTLAGFSNLNSEIVKTVSNREMYLLHEVLKKDKEPCTCPHCKRKMHIHNKYEVNLKHFSFGSRLSSLGFSKNRYICSICGYTQMQDVPFKAQRHRITCELYQYTRELLAYGHSQGCC